MSECSTRKIGEQYEEKAVEYLTEKGYRILDRNYSVRGGELDVIAVKEDTVVFVEVKYRSNSRYGDPLEAVNLRKQKHICRAALHYYSVHKECRGMGCRFDVIAIYGSGEVKHIENAFEFVEGNTV